MLSLKFKSKKLQNCFSKAEKIRVLAKFIEAYIIGSGKVKKFSSCLNEITVLRKYYLTKFSRVRIKRRCIFTNASKSISKKFGASRFVLRDFMQFGLLPGYKKSVW